MRPTFVRTLLNSIADAGRELLDLGGGSQRDTLETLCRALLSQRGEASGTALAREVLDAYLAADEAERGAFFGLLEAEFGPDHGSLKIAAQSYLDMPDAQNLIRLSKAVEPPRQELFRRMNMAPDGTSALVEMRRQLLSTLRDHPERRAVDSDLRHLLSSWFNRGFLVLERIDWRTPAVVLEKLIAYEAVHEIQGWDDLRRRLADDRRCFAFFHPALRDEPLIFVEVALVKGLADAVQPLLDRTNPPDDPNNADTAIFYSINNCQTGLRGISFGNFLIKQVVSELAHELPNIKTFATLSPIPGFAKWLKTARETENLPLIEAKELEALDLLDVAGWDGDPGAVETLKAPLTRLCAHYFLAEKTDAGLPVDPVARFHLGNGAVLERLNWMGDRSAKGVRESHGMLVNYAYRLSDIEKNHEAFTNAGTIAASSSVRGLHKG